jgi:hypothetical protein
MRKGRNNSLLYKNGIASRAMLTFGKTALGTGRRDSLVNNLGVTLGVDCGLVNDNLATLLALLTLGKTGLGTCGSATKNRLGCSMIALRIADIATYVTTIVVLVVIAVSKSRYYALLYKNLVTNRAMLTLGKTCFCTAGSNCLVNNLGMLTCSRNTFRLLLTTITVALLCTLIDTGSRLDGFPLAKGMSMSHLIAVASISATGNKRKNNQANY